MRRLNIFFIALPLFLTSCAHFIDSPTLVPSITIFIPSSTPEPTFTPTPIPATPTPQPLDQICSPLANVSLSEIPQILTQPFSMPRLRNDDGHQGIDLAFFRFNEIVGIEGLSVLAAMEGKVAFILPDRYPYGNVVVQEIPLELLSERIKKMLTISDIVPTVQPDPRLASCPVTGNLQFDINTKSRSLYILYAHLKNPPPVQVEDFLACGQQLGEVGNTGKSTNPHLHFEIRVGPSGAKFDSMSFYSTNSSSQERYNYCIWRVSQLFQLIDPLKLLATNP